MKLYYIGTGAADWTAAAGAKGGVTRRFSSAVLDGRLLIDLAPTTPLSLFDEAFREVDAVLYTHSHSDHFSPEHLYRLAETRELTVVGDPRPLALLAEHPRIRKREATADVALEVSGYTVTPLAANHRITRNPGETPLHYVIEKDGQRIFWGADGAWFPCATWAAMRRMRPYDRVVLDGTLGDEDNDNRVFEHNNLTMVGMIQKNLLGQRMLTEGGQIWLTHLSRDAHIAPDELGQELARRGLFMAKDDLEDLI